MITLRLLPLLLLGGTPLLHAGQSDDPAPVTEAEAAETGVIEVRLTARAPAGDDKLLWSPKGAKVPLAVSPSGLRGELVLGPNSEAAPVRPLRVELWKSDGTAHVDRLWIDRDADGVRDPGEVLETTPSESRGKFWSSFETILDLPLPGDEGTRAYPLALWFVEDPFEPEAAPMLRWTRRGWHQGEFRVGEATAYLLITESTLDGAFGRDDSWWLSPSAEGLARMTDVRSLDGHAWLDEGAWRVVDLDPHGRWVRIEAFDPGETRAEEEARKERLSPDRDAKRAEQPLAFGHDYEAAADEAKAAGRPLFIDFEATWCGPCKQMDMLVYTAEKVVDAAAASGVVAVKVDGDDRRDLKKKFGVEAFPTMILISAEGVELRRAVGYQSVAEMAEFLTVKP